MVDSACGSGAAPDEAAGGTAATRWFPVLEGQSADRARSFVAAVVDELATRDVTDPSLGHGEAGVALLHGYRALAGEADAAPAFATLERVLERIMERPHPWLYTGFAGIGFVMQHLAAVIGEHEETLATLDALVTETLASPTWDYAWELPSGVIGLGVYALERDAPPMVDRVVRHLASRAEHSADGVAWRTIDDDNPEGYYNLGMAHGIAGAIGFLVEVCSRPAAPTVARELLDGAVRWLREKERPDQTPRYPMTLLRRPIAYKGTLDGWCYGDPSTALMLARAGRVLDAPAWIAAGHELATRAARRTDAELVKLDIDATLCHGTIGYAHLYHILGAELADDALLASARRWYEIALDRTVIADVTQPGVQTGLAGIALALLAGYTDLAPAWNRMLLLR